MPSVLSKLIKELAEADEPTAQLAFGLLCDQADSSAKEPSVAEHWIRRAAVTGHPVAQYILGAQLYTGQDEASKTEAAIWLQRASVAGVGKARLLLSFMYQFGIGVPPSIAEAIALLESAAHSGEADAYYRLGIIYADEAGSVHDPKRAEEAFRRGAEAGEMNSAVEFAALLIKQPGDMRMKGRDMLVRAAEAGNWSALTRLARYYETGIFGWPVDEAKSSELKIRAEEAFESHAKEAGLPSELRRPPSLY